MFTDNLQESLMRAAAFAQENGHGVMTLEHVLWGLLEDPEAAKALTACGAKVSKLKKEISEPVD